MMLALSRESARIVVDKSARSQSLQRDREESCARLPDRSTPLKSTKHFKTRYMNTVLASTGKLTYKLGDNLRTFLSRRNKGGIRRAERRVDVQTLDRFHSE